MSGFKFQKQQKKLPHHPPLVANDSCVVGLNALVPCSKAPGQQSWRKVSMYLVHLPTLTFHLTRQHTPVLPSCSFWATIQNTLILYIDDYRFQSCAGLFEK